MAEELKQRRTNAKRAFTRAETSLNKAIANETSMTGTIERRYESLRICWQNVQEAHDNYMSKVEEGSQPQEEQWLDEIVDRFERMEVKIDQTMEAMRAKKPMIEKQQQLQQQPLEQQQQQYHHQQQQQQQQKYSAPNQLQLERLKLEKFTGDIRKYPSFKERFILYIVPICTESQLPFILRSHLDETVREEVDNVEDDMVELWKRLDSKYGNRSRYVERILEDLSKTAKGGGKNALHLINTVEKAERDLKRINAEEEMANSTIIAMIEKKLPEEMRFDWIKTIAPKGDHGSLYKFQVLLNFLKGWKEMIEYDEAAIRKEPEKKTGSSHFTGNVQRKKFDNCWIHEEDGGEHPIWKCRMFQAKSLQEKMDLVLKNKACQACLEIECEGAKKPEDYGCGKEIVPAKKEYSFSTTQETYNDEEAVPGEGNTLLPIQTLEVASIKRKGDRRRKVGLWDAGSTLSFITFGLAQELQIKGEPVDLEIVTVGGQTKKVNSQKYTIVIFDEEDKDVRIEVFGIEQISTDIERIEIGEVLHQFKTEDATKAMRPEGGNIDLLIGFQYAAYHPTKREELGHLLLMQNRFGLMIAGSHPSLKEKTIKLVKHAVVLHTTVNIEDFYSVEAVSCSPKCGGCSCGKCQAGGKNMTLLEEREHEMIIDGLSFDTTAKRWVAKYPWICDPSCLPENKKFAYATLRSTEKRLLRNPLHAETYRGQINDMLERKVAREVSEDELRDYKGTKFFLSHHDVLSPQSKSTPMRVVFHSSARMKGCVSLNDCLAKGPCLLNQLLGILLRFRQDEFAFIGDIRKMYHSIDIPVADQMTHLFLWRDLQTNEKPKIYAMNVVNMGDKPAAAISQTALRLTAEEAKVEYPEASDLIRKNSYMDDIPGSTSTEEKGMQLMRDTETLLEKKGFKIKNWVFSGQKVKQERSADQKAVQTLLNKDIENEIDKVLGMEWDTENDMIRFRLSQLDYKIETTKRECLSTICSIYDPIGLLAPVTVSAKIILRKVWAAKPSLEWDDPLPEQLQMDWDNFRESLAEVKKLMFNRSIKPKDATCPEIVIFSDGSKNAYGTAAYVRWKTKIGYVSYLLVAKSRIAPLKIIDTVRLELCGAVLNARLWSFIKKEMEDIGFEEVYHIVDSEIVKAMINKESYGFSTFVANRIGEIHQLTERKNWYWVEGSLNVADMTTRDCHSRELSQDSEWQKGPRFLELPKEQWPIRSDTNVARLPEMRKKFVGATTSNVVKATSIASVIDIERFDTLYRLLNTTARVEKLFKKFKGKNTAYYPEILPEDLKQAEETWIKYAQETVHEELNKTKYKKLVPSIENDIIVVGGRTEGWVDANWNRQKFILLPNNHRLSYLIALQEHESIGHLAKESTVAKIRSKYWIVGVRKIVNSIISKCRKCKEKFKKLAEQKMSPLPIERMKPSPPFYSIGVDYFGPFAIKGEVQKRIRGKCYGVIFACDSSRAIYADIVQNYSTEAFLQALRRFGCMRGWPRRIHSDNGTQLVGAASELRKVVKELDWEQIQRFSNKHQIMWSFNPADAPWQNGSTEALVKTVKKALKVSIGQQVFTYPEFQTIMYEAAQLVNQRPIGRKPTSPEEGSYLCPNDLLLGRNSSHIPQGPFIERCDHKQRLKFMQEILNNFWKRWYREVFPGLVIEPKWHTERRNLTVGDVVLVQDSNELRGEWKMGVVSKVNESKDGRVRNVEVMYKRGASKVTITRPAQRLIVLVPKEQESDTMSQHSDTDATTLNN